MKISADPAVSIGERLILEAAVERRSGEKVLTQVTSGEMGVGGDDARASDKAERLALSMDSARMSASAMARYRIFSGAKTGDEQSGQMRDEESFSRESYMISEASRAAEWKRRKEAVSGTKDEERPEDAGGVENPREPQRKSDRRSSAFRTGESGEGQSGGGGQEDPATKVRARIRDVQRMLTAAQKRLSLAAAKIRDEAGGGSAEDASGRIPADPAGGASREPATGAAEAEQAALTAAQTEMAAAESEVNALAGELMKLYQELMKALQGKNGQ